MRRISSNDVSVQYFHQQIQQVGEDLTAENKWHRFLREVFEVVYLPDQSFQTFKERIKEHRNYLQATNFRFCSYARAHHYHFFLQDFPRIPGQPTYALDMNNSLRLTYSQQEKLYKGDRLGNILNRVAFTLPVRQQFLDLFMSRKKGRTHNQAHEQLFSNQDSKWDLDRELYTCKIILKHLQKLTYNYSLWQYALIKKRFQLEFLLDDTFDIEEKKVKLQTYIDSLQQKKKSMSLIWQANDEMYFHSSLQQKLHDSIQEEYNWQFRQASKRIQYYITRHKNWVEQLSKEESDLQLVLLKIFTYTNSRVAAISEAQVENLKGHILKINNPQKTTLPFLIFNFGRPQLREKVNRMITAFIEKNQMDEDQMCKNTLKRLFRGTFQPNQLIHDIGAYESKVMTKNMRDKLKRQMVQKKDRAVQTILLDEYINQSVIDQLTADRKQCLPIFNLSQYKIPICEQQMKMLFYYNNLCKTVSLFEPLIHEDETVMKVLCSPYLDRLLHGIIGQIPIKSIGQLIYNMRDLVEYGMMSNCLKQSAVDSDFQWEFKEDTGVGIVWNEPRKLSQGKNLSHFYFMMMQKMNENQQQNNNEQSDKGKQKQNEEGFDQDEKQQLGNIPVKKVKQNQNQHY